MRKKFTFPYLRKGSYILFLLTLSFVVVFRNYYLDNDSWFLLNHGRYVFENGIPFIEPFTIHENFSFVMQQWLSSLIYYSFYKFLGIKSLLFLAIGLNFVIILLCYKLCMIISDRNYKISFLVTIIIDFLLASFYIVIRPQVFSFIFLLLLLCFLELYVKTNKVKYLLFLPIISVLQINFHASMWWMLYIFMLPYLFDGFKCKYYNSIPYKKWPLLLIMLIMFIFAFINPYGIDAITYFFNSYGIEQINNFVNEMAPLNVNDFFGKFVFVCLFSVIICYLFIEKKKIKVRYLLFFIGTTYLVLSSCKGFSYFIICSFFPLAYYFKDGKFKVDYKKEIYNKRYKFNILIACLGLIALLIECFFVIGVDYTNSLNDGIDLLLDKYNKEDIILFVGYNHGGYTEFRGIKSYLDPRAEVFLKSNNGKEDVFFEYYDLCLGKIKFEDIIEKYSFTHLLVTESERMYLEVDNITNFSLFYEGTLSLFNNGKYRIYVRDDLLIND